MYGAQSGPRDLVIFFLIILHRGMKRQFMHVGIDDGLTGMSMMGGQMVCGHFFYHLLGILCYPTQ